MKKAIVFIVVSIALNSAMANECNTSSIVPTTPTAQFVVSASDGTVLDLKTGLLWAKCPLGQTYAQGKCEGEATHYETFQEALNAADTRRVYLGYTGFRMPNIKELGSIVERQCHNPTINLAVFPDTPSATFYSNTPDPNDPRVARTINFATGEEFTARVDILRHVRMVKDSTF